MPGTLIGPASERQVRIAGNPEGLADGGKICLQVSRAGGAKPSANELAHELSTRNALSMRQLLQGG